jgi:decaprenylphospho-beta-D-erythro-pentofuranosid-2-ulose 2-reductase
MSMNIVILGATSAIAQACARRWAERGDRLLLVARDEIRLGEIAADLRVRGGGSDMPCFAMDATDTTRIPALIAFVRANFQSVDVVLIAHGTLPDQGQCEISVDASLAAISVNGVSAVTLMMAFAQLLEPQKRGTLAVIGSPAGDRGRASNYTYGSAKAMVHSFAAGLRHRLWRSGVAVVSIKPGFTDTPMTAGIEKKGPLWASPARVAKDIVAAIDAGRPVCYTPWFWRWIMLLITHLPEWLFVRTRL